MKTLGTASVLASALWVWLISCHPSEVLAQYRFDHWTINDGLPQNSVNAILQTRDGYLWLATNDGLVRYDGVRFTVFDRSSTGGGIQSNRFETLFEDRRGDLWAGTYEGMLTRYRDDAFTTYTAKDGLPGHQIIKIEEDAEGHLWVAADKSLTERRDGRFMTYNPKDCLLALSILWPARSRVWWCQDEAGLHLISRGRLITYTARDGLPNLKFTSISKDQHGCLWLGTDRGGSVRLKDGRFTIYPVKDGLPRELVGAPSYDDGRGNLWASTQSGVMVLGQDGAVASYTTAAGLLAAGPVPYEDREGTIWFGTSLGLNRARRVAVTAFTKREGLYSDWVYAILQDRTGSVWIGSWGGGLSRYQDGAFTYYSDTERLFSLKITALYEDRAGCLWVGTERGVSRFKDGRLTRYSDEHGLATVWAMREDRAGNFWFGTASGLVRYKNGSFTTYTTRDGLSDDSVEVIFEDRAGTLWLGTHGGLTRLDGGRFTAYTEQDGFGSHRVRALYEDRDGVLWIGTYDGGLHRFKDGRFTAYTTRDGLFNNGAFQIFEDGRGNFWLGSNRGIYRVSRKELNEFAEGKARAITSVAYGAKDGMPNAECNGGRQPAGWRMRDGKFWFPTLGGIAIVDPEAVPVNDVPPPVVIEEFRLGNQPISFHDGVEIKPGEDSFEVHYAGLSFINPEQVRFKYRLAELEADWMDAGNRRVAYYSHVPPGEYTFTVIAANSDGVWNEQGASLRIVVEPPWWRTWWFLTLMSLSVAGMIGFNYWRHVARLQREQRQREELALRERTLKDAFTRELLTSQEADRARIARELHDDLKRELHVIKRRAAEARQQPALPEPAQERLNEISTTTDQAIEIIAEIVHGLRPPILEAGLTESLRAIVRRAGHHSQTRFIDQIGEVDDLLPPHLEIHLYYLVQEAVLNIERHARATEAKVAVGRAAEGLLVTIQDNGGGFDPEQVAARRARGGGFGLTGISERAAILGGTPRITTAPGQGTTITLKLNLPEVRHDRGDSHPDRGRS